MIECLPAIVTCYVLHLLFMLTNHVHMYSREKLYWLNQIGSSCHFDLGPLSKSSAPGYRFTKNRTCGRRRKVCVT